MAVRKLSRPDAEMPEIDLSAPRWGKPRRGRHAKGDPAVPLRSLREIAEKTQVEVSKASGIAQGDVSKLEAREDLDELVVSTLRRYVEALGGTFEMSVSFDDGRRFSIRGAAVKRSVKRRVD